MTSETNSQQHYQQWMPTVAGVMCIVSGSLELLFGLFFSIIRISEVGFGNKSDVIIPVVTACWLAVTCTLAIAGGIFALQRRNWGLSLAGAIATLLSGNFLFGTLSIVFIALSRKEFE